MTNAPLSITLNDDTEIPQLGFGTYKLKGEDAYNAVRKAIEVGYRHIDTASLYDNEEQVGRAVRDAIAAGEVGREDLFVTTKLWHDAQGEGTADAFHASLDRLGLDYVDLYLIHWPWPKGGKFVESFEAMAKIQGLGTVQSIGVANFYEETLRELIDRTGITPVVNQIELHPGFPQEDQVRVDRELGVATESWSPLGQAKHLDEPVLQEIAEETGHTVAQVVIRWHVDRGLIVIPKSGTPERIEENFRVFDFELSDAQVRRITGISGERMGPDPREFPEAPEE